MKLLILSDIHSAFENLEKALLTEDFDAVVIAGDITHFRPSDVFKADSILSQHTDLCYAVHGNCDYEQILDYDLDVIEFIHCRSVKFNEYVIHGIGGSGITPFNTPSEYTEDELKRMVSKLKLGEKNILLSHCPPKGVLDRTYAGTHAGCVVIREYAELFDIILCGHIHESHGVDTSLTFVVNPGPVMWGRYATLDTEKLKVKHRKL